MLNVYVIEISHIDNYIIHSENSFYNHTINYILNLCILLPKDSQILVILYNSFVQSSEHFDS